MQTDEEIRAGIARVVADNQPRPQPPTEVLPQPAASVYRPPEMPTSETYPAALVWPQEHKLNLLSSFDKRDMTDQEIISYYERSIRRYNCLEDSRHLRRCIVTFLVYSTVASILLQMIAG